MNRSQLIVALVLIIMIVTGMLLWSVAIKRPSVLRDWQVETKVLPQVTQSAEYMRVNNVRNFQYVDSGEQVVDYYDQSYRIADLDSMWFVVNPFADFDALTHAQFSFGFTNGSYVGLSMEARREVNETYSPWRGMLNEYEIVYIVGDERDFFVRRAVALDNDIYLYKVNATNKFIRGVFIDMLKHADKLARHAEFYNTISSSTTTRLRRHANHVQPETIPFTMGAYLPGYADFALYELGYVATSVDKDVMREAHNVTAAVRVYKDHPDFSVKIREGLIVS